MILFGNLLIGIAQALQGIFWLFTMILIARVICSWVSASYYNPIVKFIYNITEPALEKVRRYVPNFGMIDLSPIIIFILLQLISSVLLQSLYEYGMIIKNS